MSTTAAVPTIEILTALKARKVATAKELGVTVSVLKSLVEQDLVVLAVNVEQGARKVTNESGTPVRGRPSFTVKLAKKGHDKVRRAAKVAA